MTSGTHDTALAAEVISVVWLTEIVWRTGTARLMSQAGEITFGGQTYVGVDDDWGQVTDWDSVTETSKGQVTDWHPSLYRSTAVLNEVRHPERRQTTCRVWSGVRNVQTGALIDAVLIFQGDFTTGNTRHAPGNPTVKCRFAGFDETRFASLGGITYSDSMRKQIDATDQGCEYVAFGNVKLPWGDQAQSPRSNYSSYTGGTGGTGLPPGFRGAFLGDAST